MSRHVRGNQAPINTVVNPVDVGASVAGSSSAPTDNSRAKEFVRRPHCGQLGKKVQVRTNHFKLQDDDDLHHYVVSIAPLASSEDVSRDIINKLVETYGNSMLGNPIRAYNSRNGLFTAGPLPFTSKTFVVDLVDKDQGSSSGSDSKYQVTIKSGSKTKDTEHHIHALNAVLRATPNKTYTVVGRSFFSPKFGGLEDLGGGAVLWRGFFQSARQTQMGLSLNIVVSSMPFYEPIPVPQFLSQHLHLNLNNELSDQDRLKIKKALRGIKLRLMNKRCFTMTGVSNEPFRDLKFTLKGNGTRKNAVDYYKDEYNFDVKEPHLPALQSGSDANPMYFPIEACHIVSGQKYSKSLNRKQVTKLLKATRKSPDEREHEIKQIVKDQKFNSDKIVAEFGINVTEDLHLVDARVLPTPALTYHGTGGKFEIEYPQMGQWNMNSKKMYIGGNVENWSCLCCSAINPNKFCQELIKVCIEKGMVFNRKPVQPFYHIDKNLSQIELVLKDFIEDCEGKLDSEQSLQLLIVILPDDDKGLRVYDTIKRVCETELGIISQCCRPAYAKEMSRKYLENLALKINVKVGGSNTVLVDAFASRIPLLHVKPTIIFGADVTHPNPGSSSPSIAAVVASMDWPTFTQYRGVISAQTARQEIIQDLFIPDKSDKGTKHAGMIRELIMSFFRSNNKMKPERIIFYRDGVGDGQFSQVLLEEVVAIRRACYSFEKNYEPSITFVLVQKRHHTRFFPVNKEETDKSGNIMPGTVVDTDICHSKEFDFYLNSHAGKRGTSRPTHYHVLYDENGFNADGLQKLTNDLCYTYARCTQSVSIVPPVYYAHLLAFRARCYLGAHDSGHESGTPTLPSIVECVKTNMFFV